jgi:hypothetical protein
VYYVPLQKLHHGNNERGKAQHLQNDPFKLVFETGFHPDFETMDVAFQIITNRIEFIPEYSNIFFQFIPYLKEFRFGSEAIGFHLQLTLNYRLDSGYELAAIVLVGNVLVYNLK